MLTLRVLSLRSMAPANNQQVTMQGERVGIGRATNNLMLLAEDPSVSRLHGEITHHQGRYVYSDLSANGSLLQRGESDIKLQNEEITLMDGDRLKIGEYLIAVELIEKDVKDPPPAPQILGSQLDIEPYIWPDPIENPLHAEGNGSPDPALIAPQEKFPAAPSTAFETSNFAADPFLDLLNSFAESTPELQQEGGVADNQKFLGCPPERLPSSPATAPSAGINPLLKAFMEGSGLVLNPLELSDECDSEKLMHHVGRLISTLVEESRKSTTALLEVKQQMHLDLTQLRSRNNNPLKFAAHEEAALRGLLNLEPDTYMDGAEAIREVFKDQLAHQLAMQAATQATIQAMLSEFEPEKLMKNQPEGQGLFSAKGKLWEYYVDFYPHLVEQAMKNMHGDVFVSIYEKQKLALKDQDH